MNIFNGERLWNFCIYWCLLVGFLSTIYGGNLIYKEFWLKKKVILIGETDTEDEENVSFQKQKNRR